MKKETYPHFRRYEKREGGKRKRAKHPKVIVERIGSQYGFMGLTESPKRGHHSNIPLSKNPQKEKAKERAFVRKELRYDNTSNFSEILRNYNLSSKDKKTILNFVKKLKQKKK